jgi:hypothetical protein
MTSSLADIQVPESLDERNSASRYFVVSLLEFRPSPQIWLRIGELTQFNEGRKVPSVPAVGWVGVILISPNTCNAVRLFTD